MIPLRAAALHTAGLLVAFAAGRLSMPAPAPGVPGQSMEGGNRRTGPPSSLAGRPVRTAGETWLDAAAADAAAARGAARPGEANPLLVEKLGAVLTMADPEERLARWQGLMPLMRMEDARAVMTMLRENRAEGRGFNGENAVFWRQCGRMDPATALTWAKEGESNATTDVLGGWASRDSSAALAWVKAMCAHPDTELGITIESAPFISELMKGLAAQSPEAAVELLLANGDDPLFGSCLGMATDLVIQRGGITAALPWFSGIAESGAPAGFKTVSLETLLSYGNIPADGTAPSRKGEVAQTAARYAGEPWFSKAAARDLGTGMGETDPVAGAAVMENFQNAETREEFMSTFLSAWLTKDAASMGEWLNRNRTSPSFDLMASRLARWYLGIEDMKASGDWLDQIRNPDLKKELEQMFSAY
ncbi:MAG: hypothetical protein EOP86_18005 [Verrucomicrobiaceae bacterium]|nr:MAG: hypothetical protein EOP86_18005 [Verrucomicrobiaceae bacterium]